MRKSVITVALFTLALITTYNAQSQNLGDFKPKDNAFGLNKIKKAKRVYIAAFNVTYQVYNEMVDFKQGGSMLGGGRRGDASAKASVGIDGLTEEMVQKITNQLYADYTAMLKEKNLELVTPEEAGKTKVYDDYMKQTGGGVSHSQIPGCLTATPTGYDYYIKKVDKDGREKTGGFLGQSAMLYPKLSSDLDDAIIAEVKLYVLFATPGSGAFDNFGANVKIKTQLRLADQEAVMMTDNKKAIIKMKGQNETVAVNSQVAFYHGKMGMSATSSYVGYLAKPYQINDVVEGTKVKSVSVGGADAIGTKTLYYTYYTPTDKSSDVAKVIPVDPALYEKGVYAAGKNFLEHHTKAFLKEL